MPNMTIKHNAQELVAILKPISISLDAVQCDICSIGDAIHVWKKLEINLKSVLNSNKMKIFKKQYDKALTSAHFLCYMLNPKFAYFENSIRLSVSEKDFGFFKRKIWRIRFKSHINIVKISYKT